MPSNNSTNRKRRGGAALIALLLVFASFPADAQSPRLLTVNELFDLGIENSRQLQTTRLDADIAADRLKDARMAYLPSFAVGVNGGYSGNPTVFRRGLKGAVASDIPNWQQKYTVELTQPLFTGGKIKHAVERAELEKQIATLAVSGDRADIKLYLLSRYLDLFNLYKEQDVLLKNIEESERRLHDIRQMRKEGMITQNDVIRSELQLSNYQLSLLEVKDNILILSQQLDIALGLDEDGILLPDTTSLAGDHPLLTYPEYVEEAYRSYPALKISRLDIALAQQDIRLVQADYLPQLSFRAGNTLGRPITSASPMQDLFMNNWNVALVLNYNLSSLYQSKYKLHAARRQVKVRRTQEDLLRQDIRMNVKEAYVRHREALERIRTLTINVSQADENYRIVQNKYLNHLAILTDLLDAAGVRLDAELQLTSARTNAIYTYYQLLHDIGNL